jgi:hypothetical protein
MRLHKCNFRYMLNDSYHRWIDNFTSRWRLVCDILGHRRSRLSRQFVLPLAAKLFTTGAMRGLRPDNSHLRNWLQVVRTILNGSANAKLSWVSNPTGDHQNGKTEEKKNNFRERACLGVVRVACGRRGWPGSRPDPVASFVAGVLSQHYWQVKSGYPGERV